jgi:hypothetical protein
MFYPKIIILATAGSHGDFLLQSCEIMSNGRTANIDNNGRVKWISNFKLSMINAFKAGKKSNINNLQIKSNKIELSHAYYDEFKNWPSKFFYIDYSRNHIDIVLDMMIKKVCNNDIDKVLMQIKPYLQNDLSVKINKKNYRDVLRIIWWNSIKKFKRLKNIESISLLSFYKFENMCQILKSLDVYNTKYLSIYKPFYQEWQRKNKEYIDRFFHIQ